MLLLIAKPLGLIKSLTYEDIVWKDYNEILHLLSSKYDVTFSETKEIIIEYLRIHEPLNFLVDLDDKKKISLLLSTLYKPSEDVSTTIIRLANQTLIEKSTLANIIFDFKIYQKLLDIEDNFVSY